MDLPDESEMEEWLEQTRQSMAVVQEALDALNAADPERFIGCFDENVEFWLPGDTAVSGRANNREEFARQVGQVLAYLDDPVTLDTHNEFAAGNWVLTESHGSATTHTGEDYSNTYCHVWKVENGAITRFVEYNDTDLINRVLCSEENVRRARELQEG